MQNPKKIIVFIILIALIIYIKSIDFKAGYFESDIDFFQTSVDVYSKYVATIFVLISFLFLFFRNKTKIKPKDPNIVSPEYLKYTPQILFIAIMIWASFGKITTNLSLIINKGKQVSTLEREFKIYYYDDKKEELRLIINNLEFYKMKKDIYKSLKDKKNIKLKLKMGLLGIPFDPEYKK